MFCVRCGAKLSEEQKFCMNCGMPINAGVKQQETIIQETPIIEKQMVEEQQIIEEQIAITKENDEDCTSIVQIDDLSNHAEEPKKKENFFQKISSNFQKENDKDKITGWIVLERVSQIIQDRNPFGLLCTLITAIGLFLPVYSVKVTFFGVGNHTFVSLFHSGMGWLIVFLIINFVLFWLKLDLFSWISTIVIIVTVIIKVVSIPYTDTGLFSFLGIYVKVNLELGYYILIIGLIGMIIAPIVKIVRKKIKEKFAKN